MIVKRSLVALVLVGLVSTITLAQAPNPLVGTWKLNVAKSKTAFKSGTTVIEAAGEGIKATVDLVAGDGTAYHWSWTATYDGKDHPVTGVTPYGTDGTIALTRVDANTSKIVSKHAGKVTITQTLVVSADGKTRTITTKGTDAKGQPVDSMSIYEKQ